MEIYTRRADTDSPAGTVLVTHGYGEHQGRYELLLSSLTGAGYDTVSYDLPSHGTSEGPRARVDVGALIKGHLDLRRSVAAHARTEDMFLFGHSMGGLITLASTLLEPAGLRGVVLSGPAIRPLPALPDPLVTALRGAAPFIGGLPLVSLKRPPEDSLLSRDPNVQIEADADPLTHTGGVPLLTAATLYTQGQEVARRAATLRVPLIIFHGADDALTDPEGSRAFVKDVLAAHPDADIHLRLVDGARHEVLNEPEGPALVRDIILWLGAH